jgi:hypothetical protein
MTHQPDTAVVFFSRGGNTRLGAEILSERRKAKLIELKEQRPGNALQALFRMKSRLDGDPWKQIADVRRVYLMSPIWAGSTVPAMNAFAEGADFTDKDVYVITFQNAPDQNLSHREQQHLAGIITRNHGSVRECYALLGAKMGQFAGKASILSEIGKVRLPEDLSAASVEEKIPAYEAAPAVAVEEAPVFEEVPVAEAPIEVEAPAVEEALVLKEAPVDEAALVLEEVSVAEAPVEEEAPAAKETIADEEAAAEEEVPAEEDTVAAAEALEEEIQITA